MSLVTSVESQYANEPRYQIDVEISVLNVQRHRKSQQYANDLSNQPLKDYGAEIEKD